MPSALPPTTPARWRAMLVGLALLALALIAFAVLATGLTPDGTQVARDLAISSWAQAHGNSVVTLFMRLISHMHGVAGILTLSALLALAMLRERAWRWLVLLAVTVPPGFILNTVVKNYYQRARPHFDVALVSVDSYSFPSGHTLGSTLFYAMLALYLLRHASRRSLRPVIVIAAIAMVALVAASRIYLGAHYFSDVLAASALGLAWVSLWFTVIFSVMAGRRGTN